MGLPLRSFLADHACHVWHRCAGLLFHVVADKQSFCTKSLLAGMRQMIEGLHHCQIAVGNLAS